MTAPESIEAYLGNLSPDRRATLEEIRAIVREVAPEAEEAFAYQMPGFRLDGRVLVSYAAFAHHNSLFPASGHVLETVGEPVRPYVAGKGTMRLPLDQPLPRELIAAVIRARVSEIRTRSGARSGGRGSPR
jgi:uncharacterized protein YdhG (YjbR/CyaY superfamily)